MTSALLVLNAGSSSLKFALFHEGAEPQRIVSGAVERIGKPNPVLKVTRHSDGKAFRRAITAEHHAGCFDALWDAIASLTGETDLKAVAHRIVQGGPRFSAPQRVTPDLLNELKRLSPYDPQHLPAEITLIEAAQAREGTWPQIVCFDTHFHRDLPRVARMLPIPRRFDAAGVRRYGFHGLSYQFLLEELGRQNDPAVVRGRVVLAHLGSGASLAAVRDGRCIDTTMGFTPAGGLVMATRTGNLDPGLAEYLQTTEHMDPRAFGEMINRQSGLLGISETSGDMRDLLEQEANDVRAAEAVAIFCHEAKKWIGAYAAALGGLDTLVFAGGIGEHCPPVRERVCAGLGFLGLALDPGKNARSDPLISSRDSRVSVRVIATDEERMIARSAFRLLCPPTANVDS